MTETAQGHAAHGATEAIRKMRRSPEAWAALMNVTISTIGHDGKFGDGGSNNYLTVLGDAKEDIATLVAALRPEEAANPDTAFSREAVANFRKAFEPGGERTAWLIERKDNGDFKQPHWYVENIVPGRHGWTTDANEAEQFATKADAEAYPAYKLIASDPAISITEHVFINARPEEAARQGEVDWRDDPACDERWSAGLDFAMLQLCAAIGVDPDSISFDAATETLDGDVQSVMWRILRAKFGEDFPATPRPEASDAPDIVPVAWQSRGPDGPWAYDEEATNDPEMRVKLAAVGLRLRPLYGPDALAALRAELADAKADVLRLHSDKMGQIEARIAAEAEVARLTARVAIRSVWVRQV